MKYADSTHSYQCGIINEVHNSHHGLISTHSSYVEVRFEGKFPVVDVFMSLFTDVGYGFITLFLNFVTNSMFQSVSLDYATYISEFDSYILFVHRNHITHYFLPDNSNCVSDFEYFIIFLVQFWFLDNYLLSSLSLSFVLVRFALLTSFLTQSDLFHFFENLILSIRICRNQILFEIRKLLTSQFGQLFFGLRFLDGTDGILYYCIGFFYQFVCLQLSLIYYCFTLFLQFLQLFLMLRKLLIKLRLQLVNILSFVFPISFVPYNVLKVFVCIYIVTSNYL